jgi:hypothetical protein
MRVVLLSVALALAPSGCWWLRQAPPAPPEPLTRLGVSRLAVVDFSDATHQDIGLRVTEAFRREMAQAIGKEWIREGKMEAPAPALRPIGLIGIGQAQQLGRLYRVDGLVAGQVLAYQWQPRPGRVWVSVSLRLLDTARGTIIWSRSATGTAPARTPAEIDAGFNAATTSAAKEFIHDLLASPS